MEYYNFRREKINQKNNKLPIREVRFMLPKVVAALEGCMEWMESLRASGDAGFWEWNEDAYTKAQEVLNELNSIDS
jgi:hypothetical protein